MNLAFAALLSLLLAIPGFAFIFAYRANRGRQPGVRPIADDMPVAIVAAILIHGIVGTAFHIAGTWIFGVGAYPEAALMLLTSEFGKDGKRFQEACNSLFCGWRPVALIFYFLTTCGAGIGLGAGLKKLVETYGWDRRFAILKANDWYYLLKGQTADGEDFVTDLDGIRLTAVVGDYIYWGLLSDYCLTPTGMLDSIVLELPERRKIGEGETTHSQYTTIIPAVDAPGAYRINLMFLVLKYSECKNLGILLIRLPEDKSEELDSDTDVDLNTPY